MASLLNIGITGLNAAQSGLVTTGHNISNAGTPGYSRQGLIQTTQQPVFSGVGFFGTGTRVDSIRRAYSQYLENQVLAADTKRAQLETFSAQIAQLDGMLADPEVGVSSALENFFKGVQEVAANPSSIPARQSMISIAQSMASRFQSVAARFDEIRAGTESLISSSVEQINSLSRQVAELNQRIIAVQSAGPNVPANDLLDQRNQLIRELNQMVRVSTLEESNGTVSVFIGSGQQLVVGGVASQLSATPSSEDPSRLAVGLEIPSGGRVVLPDSVLGGGQLGGALTFRSSALDKAQNQLGLVAAGIAMSFNTQHQLGQDLDGAFGQAFFGTLSPTVKAVAGAGSVVNVGFGAVQNLTADEYLLTINSAAAAGYVLTRRSDGATVNAADVGLTVSLGATVNGEQFLIQPTRNAARELAVSITDPRLVAASDPVLGNAAVANSGSAVLSEIRTLSVTGMDGAPVDNKPDFATLSLSFDPSVGGRFVLPAGYSPATLFYNPGIDAAGKDFTVTSPAGFSFSFRLSGRPSPGDVFSFSPNRNGAGIGVLDNRNMLELGALQFNKTLLTRRDATGAPIAGQATAGFQAVYAQMVTDVGAQSREARVGEQAQIRLLEQVSASREALSGVNLDEEASNLVRFQQAYQASARVMQVAGRLFDEILAIAR